MSKLLFPLILTFSMVVLSCSKDNEQEIKANYQGDNPPGCSTLNMTYSNDIGPILVASCNYCHKPSNALGGIITDNYTSLKQIAASGQLVGTITHANAFPAMPLNKPQLSECNIFKIKAWIAQGTKNN
jgi:hypothetical protein